MLVYRMSTFLDISDAFSGEGTRIAGGRWTSPGIPAVYTASSKPLALLEILANTTDISTLIWLQYFVFKVTINDDLIDKTYNNNKLPIDWYKYPAPGSCKTIGDAWFSGPSSKAVLEVPSALVKTENNYILNPRHKDFSKITISTPEPVEIDSRLIR